MFAYMTVMALSPGFSASACSIRVVRSEAVNTNAENVYRRHCCSGVYLLMKDFIHYAVRPIFFSLK